MEEIYFQTATLIRVDDPSTDSINSDIFPSILQLDKPVLTIGRSLTCDITFNCNNISLREVKFCFQNQHWTLSIFKYTKDILINGGKVRFGESLPLVHGDLISFGSITYTFVEDYVDLGNEVVENEIVPSQEQVILRRKTAQSIDNKVIFAGTCFEGIL